MAAIKYKITYKNHCTPQEYITENSRWYLDSDVGARLTGTAVWGPDSTEPTYGTGSIAAGVAASIFNGGYDFVYIKNTSATGGGGINISLADEDEDGSEADSFRIYIGPGESFASKVAIHAGLKVKGVTDTATYECIYAT